MAEEDIVELQLRTTPSIEASRAERFLDDDSLASSILIDENPLTRLINVHFQKIEWNNLLHSALKSAGIWRRKLERRS